MCSIIARPRLGLPSGSCIKIINVIWGQIIPKKFTNAVTASGRNTFQERSAKVLQTLLQLLADLDAERLCLSRSQDGEFNLFPPPAPSWQHPGRHRYAGEPQPNCYRGEFCTHLREILNSSQMPPIRWWTRWRSLRRGAASSATTWSLLLV